MPRVQDRAVKDFAEFDRYEQYLINEFYDDYRAGEITRRTFVRRLAYITGGMAGAASTMVLLGCGAAEVPDPTSTIPAAEPTGAAKSAATAATSAATATATVVPVPNAKSPLSVPEGDPAVRGETVRFASGSDQITGYLARPAQASTGLKGILICHENAGMTAHFPDVARRFAKAGYAALALDLLSREGGTANLQRDQVSGMLTQAGIARHVADFEAARKFLGTQQGVDGARIGMTGYCFGGGVTWAAATQIPELKAAIPYYGPAPDLAAVPNIKAAVLGVYGETDSRINAGIDGLRGALEAASIRHELKIYPGVGHAFNNDTSANWAEAQQAQADAAWKDSLAWFERYV
ncbi:MAG: dienelactone hydrolase family protein [Dehalococcoidia bacterium]|nr:dienelactone hydrolase family protein [Dehalococcoidia bacterium]